MVVETLDSELTMRLAGTEPLQVPKVSWGGKECRSPRTNTVTPQSDFLQILSLDQACQLSSGQMRSGRGPGNVFLQ